MLCIPPIQSTLKKYRRRIAKKKQEFVVISCCFLSQHLRLFIRSNSCKNGIYSINLFYFPHNSQISFTEAEHGNEDEKYREIILLRTFSLPEELQISHDHEEWTCKGLLLRQQLIGHRLLNTYEDTRRSDATGKECRSGGKL